MRKLIYECINLQYYVIHKRGIWFALNRVYSVITKWCYFFVILQETEFKYAIMW